MSSGLVGKENQGIKKQRLKERKRANSLTFKKFREPFL